VDGMNLYAGYFAPNGTDPSGTIDAATAAIRASFREYRQNYFARQRARTAAYRQKMRSSRAGRKAIFIGYIGGAGGGTGPVSAGGNVYADDDKASEGGVSYANDLWGGHGRVRPPITTLTVDMPRRPRRGYGGPQAWGYTPRGVTNPWGRSWNLSRSAEEASHDTDDVDDRVGYWDAIAALMNTIHGVAADAVTSLNDYLNWGGDASSLPAEGNAATTKKPPGQPQATGAGGGQYVDNTGKVVDDGGTINFEKEAEKIIKLYTGGGNEGSETDGSTGP